MEHELELQGLKCKVFQNKRGDLHRKDGPAVIFENGIKLYYQNGLFHRIDGPAVISPGETEEWYQIGRDITGEARWFPVNLYEFTTEKEDE